MVKIGVLALQGAVSEHLDAIEKAEAAAIPIKKVEQLADIDGIIIPSGEITAISNLMQLNGFIDGLKAFHQKGKPIFGTSAGLILMAKEIEDSPILSLGLMDIKVERNAFKHLGSNFEAEVMMPGIAVNFKAIFIRSPFVKEIAGECKILAKFEQKIIAVQQGTLLGTAFHPELSDDVRLHHYFINMVKSTKI